jgi:hypothetical protein
MTSASTNTQGDITFDTSNATTDTTLTERMRIKGNGNVGIGTTNPQQALEVTGRIRVSDNIENSTGGAANVISGQLPYIHLSKGSQTFTDDILGIIDFNTGTTTVVNRGSFTINVDGSITVPSTGLYKYDIFISWTSTTGGIRRLANVWNGVNYGVQDINAETTPTIFSSCSFVIPITTTAQSVTWRALQDSGGDLDMTSARLILTRIGDI